jgi:dTDP-glucose 4,6-dehydratase
MKLLITGGCGFIGTNYIRWKLAEDSGVSIVNLDKLTYAGNRANLIDLEESEPRYSFIHGDICDAETLREILTGGGFDAVLNFAAESHVDRSIDDPAPFITTNVLGAQAMVQAAREAGVPRFVHISTDEVYGSLGPDGQFYETTPLAPNSPYSASKAGADLLMRAYHETYRYDVVVTRCSNNYGPYQFPEKLIPLMYKKAVNDESLPVYGDGKNVRDWIYVLDHCRGVDLALTKGKPGGIYNFGGDCEMANIDLVKSILAKLDKPESLISFVTDRPGHDKRYAMNFDLAAEELGFQPQYTFETGLDATLTWYKDNAEWLEAVESGAYRDFMENWYKDRGQA